jgi:hypothetical protein
MCVHNEQIKKQFWNKYDRLPSCSLPGTTGTTAARPG